jgi:hypothetical protein
MSEVSPADKALAKSLYIAGESPDKIAKTLGLSGHEIITNWAKLDGWMEERSKALAVMTSEVVNKLITKRKDDIEGLDVIMETSLIPIKDKSLTPESHHQASAAFINALRIKRETTEFSLSQSFILTTVNAVSRWITDENLKTMTAIEIKQKITEEMVKLFDDLTKEARTTSRDQS